MRSFVAAVLVSLLVAGCNSSSDKPGGEKKRIVLTGSSTIAPLAGEIGKRFEELHPGVRVDVQTGGSSRGVSDAREGLADIGMASRALKKEESDLKEFRIALDGVCLVVHKDNPVESLSDQQIIDVFTGKTTKWKDVGGNDRPITVINRADGRSEVELFTHYCKLKNSDIKAQSVAGENQQGLKTVAGNPNAIVYMSIGSSESEVKNGAPIKLLPLGGKAASIENVRSGSFPMSRPLIFITKI